ncbi:MAG: hypothetical protein FWC27_08965 [Firmicutes bacterium]|nr:hypothetical protein [Bacillota bacterium]
MKRNYFQKLLCVLFTALAVFCAAMTGTYAWRDAAQHKSNEYYGGLTTRTDTTITEPDTTTQSEPTVTTATTTETPSATTETTTQTTTQTITQTTTAQTTTQTTSQTYTLPSTSGTSARTGTTHPGGPVTGDTGKICLWASLTVLSAIGLRAVLLWGAGRRREETV